jgi:hypothetical protein
MAWRGRHCFYRCVLAAHAAHLHCWWRCNAPFILTRHRSNGFLSVPVSFLRSRPLWFSGSAACCNTGGTSGSGKRTSPRITSTKLSDWLLLHFNARSVCNKIDNIAAEVSLFCASVVCVTETWLTAASPASQHNIVGYVSYCNHRVAKAGGGVMVLVREGLSAAQLTPVVTANDAFNVCAVTIGNRRAGVTVVVGYRAPWATYDDTKSLFNLIDAIITRCTERVIITGDFNLPHIDWCAAAPASSGRNESLLTLFAREHGLVQLARMPTRESALLDLIFVTSNLCDCRVEDLPPVAESDHNSQLLHVPHVLAPSSKRWKTVISYEQLANVLNTTVWSQIFASCITADDYAASLTATLVSAIRTASTRKPLYRRIALPRHIVRMLRAKKRLWLAAKRSGNYSQFKQTSRNVRSAIRQHRRNREQRLIYSSDRKVFFAYVNSKCSDKRHAISIVCDGVILTDAEAADLFQFDFKNSFSIHNDQINLTNNSPSSVTQTQLTLLNCNESLVMDAISQCSNSNSSSDGISFRLIKAIAKYLVQPLNTVYQHAFNESIFPAVWKHATVLPLYKGTGERSDVTSYRPISLCASRVV